MGRLAERGSLDVKRIRLPTQATEATLKERFELEFVSHGPTERGWEGDYLRCPVCTTFVLKGHVTHACPCGNIAIDSAMLRVTVEKGPESPVDTYKTLSK
jgi:hypothetical protein